MSRSELRISCRRAEVLLDAYLDGDLPGPRKSALERHLAGCFACAQELQRARIVRDGLRALPERFAGDHVTEAALARFQRETAAAGTRFRKQRSLRWVLAWQPVTALAAMVLLVLGVTRFVTRPPVEQSISPADVARAETQVRWVMAHLGEINKRTAEKVRDDVLRDGVAEPASRAVASALGEAPRQ